jgi:hypothetical protein
MCRVCFYVCEGVPVVIVLFNVAVLSLFDPKDGSDMFLRNVGRSPNYTALQPGRPYSYFVQDFVSDNFVTSREERSWARVLLLMVRTDFDDNIGRGGGCMWSMQCNVEYGYHLSICCCMTAENHGKPWSSWPVTGPSGCKLTSSQQSGINTRTVTLVPICVVALVKESKSQLCCYRRSLGLCVKHPSGPKYRFLLLRAAGLLMWGALSDEGMRLSFTIAAGPRQRSHSRLRVPRDSWPYLLSQIRDSLHPTRRARSPYLLYQRGTGWPCYAPRHCVTFSSPATAMV